MYKTMHEKANASSPTPAPNTTSQTTPAEPTTRASGSTPKPKPAPNATPAKLDKTLFDLLTDVTAELIVESAKLDRLGRYLTKNKK